MYNKEQANELNKVVSFLKDHFRPLRLFLFGSRANLSNKPDSDYDFLMVMPEFDSTKRHELMSEISFQTFKGLGVEVQVWVYSQDEFNEWKNEFSSIPETAMSTGREIDLG